MGRVGVASAPSTVQAVAANEVRNFPSMEGADAAQPEWWEESGAGATLTEEDVAGELITETWERALKLVTTGDDYAYQRYTYADEPRLKVGRVVSARVAVWAVGGATARVRIASSIGSLGVEATTDAEWEILTVEAIVLDGTYVELRLEVNTGTAYFVPLAFGIGQAAPHDLAPRGLRFRWQDAVSVKTLTGLGDEATWTDIDVTAATSPLAAIAVGTSLVSEPTDGYALYFRRNGSAQGTTNLTARGKADAAMTGDYNEWTMLLDDQQVFEYFLDRYSGAGTLDVGTIAVCAWWEWA